MVDPTTIRDSGPEQVVRHLEALILDGGLAPGADELAISRLTVREGVKVLAARGLVDVRRGRRSTVAAATAQPLTAFFDAAVRRDPRALMELLELRFAVEVAASSLAAARANDDEVASLRDALERMRELRAEPDAYNAADLEFHALIAAASGNRMFDVLIQGMEQPLRASRAETLRAHLAAHGPDIDDLIAEHEAVFDAIAARDPRAAAAAMRRHLTQTGEDLRAATGAAVPPADSEETPA